MSDDESRAAAERRAAKKALKRERRRAEAEAAAMAAEAGEVAEEAEEATMEEALPRKRARDEVNGDDATGEEKKKKKDKKKLKASTAPAAAVANVAAYRAKHEMTVEGDGADTFVPYQTFADTGFDEASLACCSKFKAPTPIQAQCWPVLQAGRDIIGIAATGSGKTFAFALPAIAHIRAKLPAHKPAKGGPAMLVLAPTRELAMQTDVVCNDAGKASGIRSVCIYGGMPKDAQRQLLQSRPHVVVATPGRLLDFISEGAVSLDRVSYLVLDEADRMLDLGFERDIRAILSKVPSTRQTAMFSATWPTSIQAMAHEFLARPIKVVIGSPDLAASHSVKQIVEVLEQHEKEARLDAVLRKYHASRKNRVLVFVLYKKEADRIERFLQRKGWVVGAIHGDKSQRDRTAVVEAFKKGTTPLLIATDVAARGLDIPDVEYVINVTFPLTIEDYVHRIGRTGRGGKTGVAHTFFTPQDKSHGGELVKVLKEANQTVPEDLLKYDEGIVKKKEHKLYGAHFKEIDITAKPTKITFDDD